MGRRTVPRITTAFARLIIFLLATLLALSACGVAPQKAPAPPVLRQVPAAFSARALSPQRTCADTFVRHTLDHTTVASSHVVRLYESNGAGVAINDLDADGDLDVVLANLHGPNSIFWNEGELRYRVERLPQGDSRAVNIVDLDGDTRQEIVFTRRFASPVYLRDTGGVPGFVQDELPDIHSPFYSMNWGDLDVDGDLDLVAASYDTELQKDQGAIFNYRGGGAGVFAYLRQGQAYNGVRLAKQADALAILLPDINADGLPDIIVGNDFARPDNIWLGSSGGWIPAQPFARTSENTMSLDVGDVDNDGSPEIFATDMKPYNKDVRTMALWRPMMQMMTHPTSSADPQITENVLQVRGADGRYRNEAYQRGVDAAGWSWSSKLGDLNNDGFLDIYAVNGMIADGLFDHLPDHELVEQNQAFRNKGAGEFTRAPDWGLDSTASGRGMSMGDLDLDGDLDIVVNNLRSPAELFENRLCGGVGLEVDLFWPKSGNTRAIGAQLALHTSVGILRRDVRAASGYLSGDPARVHFGFPPHVRLDRLEVRWPDRSMSTTEELRAQTLVTVTR